MDKNESWIMDILYRSLDAALPEFQAEVDAAMLRYAPLTSHLLSDKTGCRWHMPKPGIAPTVLKVCEQDSTVTTEELSEALERSNNPVIPEDREEAGGKSTIHYYPLPIAHKDFSKPEDAVLACRYLAEMLERMVVGYDTFPKVCGLLNTPGAVQVPGETPHARIVEDLYKQRHYGPFTIVCSDRRTEEDRAAYLGQEHIQYVVGTTALEGDRVILFEQKEATFRLVVGLTPRVVKWGDGYKAVALVVPQPRQDHDGSFRGVVVVG